MVCSPKYTFVEQKEKVTKSGIIFQVFEAKNNFSFLDSFIMVSPIRGFGSVNRKLYEIQIDDRKMNFNFILRERKKKNF